MEVMRSQCVEDDVDVLQMLGPRGTVNQNVIKNTSTNRRK
jgi:hypothetical protein